MLVSTLRFQGPGARFANVQWFYESAIVWSFRVDGGVLDSSLQPPAPAIHAGTTVHVVVSGSLSVSGVRSFTLDEGDAVALPTGGAWHTRAAASTGAPVIGVCLALPVLPPSTEPVAFARDAVVRRSALEVTRASTPTGVRRATCALIARLRRLGLAEAADPEPLVVDVATLQASRALDEVLSRLDAAPAMVDMSDLLRVSPRQVERKLRGLSQVPSRRCGFREALRRWRTSMACFALTSDDAPGLDAVARATGYGSAIALCHGFARDGLPRPAALRRVLTR